MHSISKNRSHACLFFGGATLETKNNLRSKRLACIPFFVERLNGAPEKPGGPADLLSAPIVNQSVKLGRVDKTLASDCKTSPLYSPTLHKTKRTKKMSKKIRASKKLAAPVTVETVSPVVETVAPSASLSHVAAALVTVAAAAVNAPPAKPMRPLIGINASLDVAALHPALVFNGAPVNGGPIEHPKNDPPFLSAVTLHVTDAYGLYTRALLLLASAGASVGSIDPLDLIPTDATDPLTVYFLSNRETKTRTSGHFSTTRVSDADRLFYMTRAAQRLITAADRLATDNRRIRGATYNGGFNSRVSAEIRRDDVAVSLLKTLTS